MKTFETKQPIEMSENIESGKIKQETIQSIDKINKTGIFDSEFLNQKKLIVFGENKIYKLQNGTITEVSKKDFPMMDFMQGKRTDFVGIDTKKDFEQRNIDSLNDKQALPFIFFKGELAYDEFVAHEIAHNLFDIKYKKEFGEYQEKNNIPEISDEYRNKIKEFLTNIISKYYPALEVDKFSFNRQQICEIFAMIYEREFCNRASINTKAHEQVEENIKKFIDNPEEELKNFNYRHGKNCSMEDFFKENHILSLVIAPLLEREYPGFNERIGMFWK